jgi:hypothetical protein
MSHVAKVDLEVRDLGCLAKAAEHLGLELVQGQQTYRWYGRSVGDYPMPAGFKASDLGKCEHAIRIPGASCAYEIGVVGRKDGKPGYQLLWDFWAGGYGMQAKVGNNGDKLKQEYAVQVAMKHARAQGYQVSRKQKEDGSVVLRAVK